MPRATRIDPARHVDLVGDADYADGFEVVLEEPDPRSAEEWMRCAFERAPWALHWIIHVVHRYLIRFRLGPRSSPDHVLGWRIVTSEPDVIHVEASSPLMRAAIVGRRTSPTSTTVSTFLFFSRPAAARLMWAAVGPIHRSLAPYLLQRAARVGARS